MADRPLTWKQKNFAHRFVEHGNALRAAREAGYTGSDATLAVVGSENINKPNVMALVEELKHQQEVRTGVDPDRIVNELAVTAFSDLAQFVEWDGKTLTLKPFSSLPKGATRAIKRITTKPDGTVTIELHEKMAALDKLMRHFGMFAADNSSIPPPIINVSNRTENVLALESLSLEQLSRLAGIQIPELPSD